MKPYKTNPVIVERIWGGKKLLEYNKDIGKDNIGESWETGPLRADIPVLIKFIDAKETISVQVHPDDEFARRIENARNGKAEAWIILDCKEDSSIIYGFNKLLCKEEFKNLVGKGLISEVLNYVKVKKGDCIYIPAGTVHSIGKGILLYEVQQPSDLTYRIYDWNRTDLYGKTRELHIDKAAEAINYFSVLPCVTNIYDFPKDIFFDIIKCRYFGISFRYLKYKKHHSYESGKFRAITMISGSAVLQFEDSQLLMKKGDTCIIPKEYDRTVRIEGLEDAEYIVSTSNL